MKGERICSNSLFFLGSCNDFFFPVLPMGQTFINKLKYILFHCVEGFAMAIMTDKGSQAFWM